MKAIRKGMTFSCSAPKTAWAPGLVRATASARSITLSQQTTKRQPASASARLLPIIPQPKIATPALFGTAETDIFEPMVV